jgi:FtsP/CotA-like multicopper oxidase with cupredoxin domain
VNRICAARGAINGVCLKPKVTLQHDGEKGVGYRAIIPTDESKITLAAQPLDEALTKAEGGSYKDTVTALPGQVTTIRARFTRRGKFVWHCHFLSHEDHEMMRVFQVF